MAFPWDPQSVLDVCPENRIKFHCVGVKKNGSRCGQTFFSSADLVHASQILNTMALSHPASRAVRGKLADLAYLRLCPRWHRNPGYCQVSEMVQKWQRKLQYHCVSTTTTRPIATARRRLEVATRSEPSIVPSLSQPVRPRRSSSPAPETLIDEPPAQLAPHRSHIPPPRPTVSSTPPSSPPRSPAPPLVASQLTPTPDASLGLPILPTTPTSQNNASAVPSSLTITTSPRPLRQNSASATVSPAPSTPVPPVPVHTPCSRPHSVRRKPISDCCICYEAICCLDEAVWCRAQCGQNIHRECFRDWRAHSLSQAQERRRRSGEGEEDMSAVVNCVYCRARWRWEWED